MDYVKKPSDHPEWCGLRDDPHFVQCCCNCVYHLPVHHHCHTKPKPTPQQMKLANVTGKCVCGVQKGWACVCPVDHTVFDQWPEHSIGCEMYTPIEKGQDLLGFEPKYRERPSESL